ncbi:MAG: MnhB domain-containing protein [Akkermansiaceae bacterium]
MSTFTLKIAARALVPLLFILSLIILYRGHNFPGGGFIGGLIAAASVMLLAIAHGWETTMKLFPLKFVDPIALIIAGLAIAMLSGLIGIFAGHDLFKGIWLPFFELPLIGKVKLGTPFLFDVGVYLGVVGFATKCAHALGTENINTRTY